MASHEIPSGSWRPRWQCRPTRNASTRSQGSLAHDALRLSVGLHPQILPGVALHKRIRVICQLNQDFS